MKYFTYAIGQPGFIKIGKALDPAQRLATLQIGNPVRLELLGVRSDDIERDMHATFVEFGVARVRGEWFVDTDRARELLFVHGFIAFSALNESLQRRWDAHR